MATISNVEDTILHSALVDMIGQPFDHQSQIRYEAHVLFATKNSRPAHDLLLDKQMDSTIDANEPLLVYFARHLTVHARLVEASAPNTSIFKHNRGHSSRSVTFREASRNVTDLELHVVSYMHISLKPPTYIDEISEIFTTLQPSVEALARNTSAMNADAGQQPRRDRVRQGGRRPLGNY
jgi:hypothetical protein